LAESGPGSRVAMKPMELRIPAGDTVLDGEVGIPEPVHGVVVFAHSGGSSRHSPRNQFVAERLRDARLATVLVDLLTPGEERADATTGAPRFNIALLAHRVTDLTDWVAGYPDFADLRVGLFGTSTGAAAALRTAAVRRGTVRAVVSRGGRPDLAGEYLHLVRAPTLLIVGERDEVVIELNRAASYSLVSAETRLEIVPGATHLFPEPGAREQVAALATDWFTHHLASPEKKR
jgi:putative phosphoribosyl transferase